MGRMGGTPGGGHHGGGGGGGFHRPPPRRPPPPRYHHGGYHHHSYYHNSADSDLCCCLCLLTAACLGACIPDAKKKTAGIICQAIRLPILIASIALLIVYYTVGTTKPYTSWKLDNQFPLQVHFDPEDLGVYRFRVEDEMYNFYRCDITYDVNYKINNDGYVVGDFVYYDIDVQFNITYDGTFDIEIDGDIKSITDPGIYSYTVKRTAKIQNTTTNDSHHYFYQQQDISYCEKVDGRMIQYTNQDEIYGIPSFHYQNLRNLTAVDITLEVEEQVGSYFYGFIILLVVYVFVGLICLFFFQNCLTCCGLFCCCTDAYKKLGQPAQVVVKQEVVQQPQPQTIIVSQQPVVQQSQPPIQMQPQMVQYQQPAIYQQQPQPQQYQMPSMPQMDNIAPPAL